MTRCQICGHRKPLNRVGMIRHHHVNSAPCRGAGHLPIEQSDAALAEALADHEAIYTNASASIAALTAARANYIDPMLYTQMRSSLTEKLRLRRRLDRHRKWPERFARQMEMQGWGDPPPEYLVANG